MDVQNQGFHSTARNHQFSFDFLSKVTNNIILLASNQIPDEKKGVDQNVSLLWVTLSFMSSNFMVPGLFFVWGDDWLRLRKKLYPKKTVVMQMPISSLKLVSQESNCTVM